MSLKEERWKFSMDLAKLVLFINSTQETRYSCAIDQVKRTRQEASANAAAGKGIRNSLHLLGLAGDVLIYDRGEYLKDSERYRFAGDYWKSLDERNRWGGDFARKDGNHFSREYNGIK